MAKVLKRLNATAVRFQFELTVQQVQLDLEGEGPLCIKWSRGSRTAQSTSPTASPWDGPNLVMISTLYMGKTKYQEKQSKLVIKRREIAQNKHVMIVAVAQGDFNLASCITPGEERQSTTVTIAFSKCSDKNASITFQVRVSAVKGEAEREDSLSDEISDLGEQDDLERNDDVGQLMLHEMAGLTDTGDPLKLIARQHDVISFLQNRLELALGKAAETKEMADYPDHQKVERLERELAKVRKVCASLIQSEDRKEQIIASLKAEKTDGERKKEPSSPVKKAAAKSLGGGEEDRIKNLEQEVITASESLEAVTEMWLKKYAALFEELQDTKQQLGMVIRSKQASSSSSSSSSSPPPPPSPMVATTTTTTTTTNTITATTTPSSTPSTPAATTSATEKRTSQAPPPTRAPSSRLSALFSSSTPLNQLTATTATNSSSSSSSPVVPSPRGSLLAPSLDGEWNAYLELLSRLQSVKRERTRLSEYVNTFEVQLVAKDRALDELRKENELLRRQLSITGKKHV